MRKYSNVHDINLPVAVYLAYDSYDHVADDTSISATGLMKSARQIVLGKRVPVTKDHLEDLSALLASKMGSAVHDSIEQVWTHHYREAMENLGIPAGVIDRIVIQPEGPVKEGNIPVYLEKRSSREIMGITVSGKFDMVFDGRVKDFKTTGTFSLMSNNKDADYALQGSIYRWLNPDIITDDHMDIHFMFTDWSAMRARSEKDKGYPQIRSATRSFPLMSPAQTEAWITRKLTDIAEFMDAEDADIPHCTDRELWRADAVWKYYANPEKRARATKNFTNVHDANVFFAGKAGKGIVVEVPGKVRACNYCKAAPVCGQRQELINCGDLDAA